MGDWVDIQLKGCFVPTKSRTQWHYLVIYKYYCNVLGSNHDPQKTLISTCLKFGIKRSTVYNARAFGRQLKALIDPEERAWQEELALKKEINRKRGSS